MNRLFKIAFVTALFICFSSCGYKVMKKNEETVMKSWADVESSLHRRANLIPDLFEFVRNYAPKESKIIDEVIKARAKTALIQFSAKGLSDPKAIAEFSDVQSQLSSVLSKLMEVVDRYPDLKANQNFTGIWNNIVDAEKKMAEASSQYNEAAKTFNQSIKKFPYNVTNTIFLRYNGKQRLNLKPTGLL